MKTKHLIEGLQILQPYYQRDDVDTTFSKHKMLFVRYTDFPLDKFDVKKMVKLGWLQEHFIERYETFTASDYRPGEHWCAYLSCIN